MTAKNVKNKLRLDSLENFVHPFLDGGSDDEAMDCGGLLLADSVDAANSLEKWKRFGGGWLI